MTTDTKQDYTIDEVALWRAGINPSICHRSVRCAADSQLSGYEKAVSYLEQLEEQIEAGILKPSHVEPPPEGGGCLIVVGSDEVYLSAKDARNWQPEENNPLKSNQSKTNKTDSDKSAQTSALLIIALLTDSFHKDNERGGQTLAMRHLQQLAEQLGISDKNLSEPTLKRILKAARDKLKESQ